MRLPADAQQRNGLLTSVQVSRGHHSIKSGVFRSRRGLPSESDRFNSLTLW